MYLILKANYLKEFKIFFYSKWQHEHLRCMVAILWKFNSSMYDPRTSLLFEKIFRS